MMLMKRMRLESIKDVKEQDVYMGDLPLMTENGTFIINGTERVVVSQMHRSPESSLTMIKVKLILQEKILYAARIIPYRGSWLDFEFDAKDILNARIDRKKKFPATTVLYSLGFDSQEILSLFYKTEIHSRHKDGWKKPFIADNLKGIKAVYDLVDAKNKK